VIASLLSDLRIRFIIAGGSAAAVNWLIRFPFSLVMPYTTALIAAQAVGWAYGFVIYRNWAFNGAKRRGLASALRDFMIVNAAGAATTILIAISLKAGLLAALVPITIAEAMAHACGIAVGAVVNYLGHKHLTFRVP
jgi:energy-coupling factor transport system substrate-specific component